MPAKDLGTKHTCFKCATKFYDLKKGVAVCPKCGADQRESPASKAPSSERRSRPARAPEPEVEPVAEEAEGEESLDEIEDEIEDEDR